MAVGLEVPIFLAAAAAGLAERAMHARRLRSIPLRICVNGTRGKSSVTRLIAAGLRGAGVSCLAKTTGTAPRLILPGGGEETLPRRGQARIIEQKRVVSRASRLGVQALVVECMALAPENQLVFERMLTASTIGVITNVRLDHRDLMGETLEEVEEALANTVPAGATLVLGPTKGGSGIAERCRKMGATLVRVQTSEQDEEAASLFPYTAFPENIAVALKVCELCGVPRTKALEGMLQAEPDPGVRPLKSFGFGGKKILALDAFAANDFESTVEVWERFGEKAREGAFVVMALNHREDRPWRAGEMERAALIVRPDLEVFLGEGSPGATRRSGTRLLREPSLSSLLGIAGREAGDKEKILLFLCGNVKGAGVLLQKEIDAFEREEG